jgi:hypothetical protein
VGGTSQEAGANGEDKKSAASEQTKLNYIDKVAQASVSISKSESRLLLVSWILSVLLLAISTGVVSLNGEYSVAGLKISIPLPVALWSGGTVLAILSVAHMAIHEYSEAFLSEIERLYKDLDYQVPMDKAHPFEANDAVDAIWARFAKQTPPGLLAAIFDVVGTYILLGAVMILPIVTEVVVVLALARTVGWELGWAWVPAILLVIITLASYVAYWRRSVNS